MGVMMTKAEDSLVYKDSDGATQKVEGCSLYKDKAGRWWLWSTDLERNLAYKITEKEDCLLSAIDSLLFIIRLRDERITSLQRIADLAQKFADEVKPDEEY